MNIAVTTPRISSKLIRVGGDLRIVVTAQHPQGSSACSDPMISELAARAQALERLVARLAGG
jgi:hypothetical protein